MSELKTILDTFDFELDFRKTREPPTFSHGGSVIGYVRYATFSFENDYIVLDTIIQNYGVFDPEPTFSKIKYYYDSNADYSHAEFHLENDQVDYCDDKDAYCKTFADLASKVLLKLFKEKGL